ncbi:MAG: CPBP family intramembrane metalloprotease [Spirulina sp. SIO3F2]|nr:CPBP family intramembrane metalloprotease [Spirulina sp. SIO3F2]
MTVKRLALILATVLVAARLLFSLLGSLQEPQVQSRIELYQTDLVLTAAEWESPEELGFSTEQILGADPYAAAQRQYQAADNETTANIERLESQLKAVLLLDNVPAAEQTQRAIDQETQFHYQLQLKIGLLQAIAGNTEPALFAWQRIPATDPVAPTAQLLSQLWQDQLPEETLVQTVEQVQTQLMGWFQRQVLSQLFTIADAPGDLNKLHNLEQQAAETALIKLGIVSALPALGGLIGVGTLLFLLGQWAFKRQDSLLGAPLAMWDTPWDWETTGLVIVGGFFFFSQIFLATVLPIVVQILGVNPAALALRGKALYILVSYILMTAGGLTILISTVKPFRPLPKGWFDTTIASRWPLWGIGGYWVAIPLVLLVSLLNQQLWQGQGGGNPIILLALEAKDPIALLIFWSTAAIAAPVFEEIMFRGFLLPSLTRYLPTWGAIGVTSLVFAIAHLSLAELLPLAVLGCILGFVYGRSRNLLACILLHSLWNSGTLVSLFVLGS